MSKKSMIDLYLILGDSFSTICRSIDSEDCQTEKCPFVKKGRNGDFVCIFEEKGMNVPYNWKEEGE